MTATGAIRVRAVVADLDGTLVRPDFTISKMTLDALDVIKAAGLPLVIATARTPPGFEYLKVLAGRTDIAVCCSGAIGWSGRERACLWQERIDAGVIRTVVRLAVTRGAGVASFDGKLWRMTSEYDLLSPGQPHGPVRQAVSPAELAAAPCCTMAVRHAGDLAGFGELLAGQAKAALSHVGRSTLLDVMPADVDKGTGASRALASLGIEPASAVSFGDMPNDLPLFRVTGRGYAVGTSHPAVVGAAHEVLSDVRHDGFGHKIAELAASGWLAG